MTIRPSLIALQRTVVKKTGGASGERPDVRHQEQEPS